MSTSKKKSVGLPGIDEANEQLLRDAGDNFVTSLEEMVGVMEAAPHGLEGSPELVQMIALGLQGLSNQVTELSALSGTAMASYSIFDLFNDDSAESVEKRLLFLRLLKTRAEVLASILKLLSETVDSLPEWASKHIDSLAAGLVHLAGEQKGIGTARFKKGVAAVAGASSK
jgi:hypothetical protein